MDYKQRQRKRSHDKQKIKKIEAVKLHEQKMAEYLTEKGWVPGNYSWRLHTGDIDQQTGQERVLAFTLHKAYRHQLTLDSVSKRLKNINDDLLLDFEE